MSIETMLRQLSPAYRFMDDVFVWSCSECAKMFFLPVEEAHSDNIPAHLTHEFTRHTCVSQGWVLEPSPAREDIENLMLSLEIDRRLSSTQHGRE
jgi:hypothetical protein